MIFQTCEELQNRIYRSIEKASRIFVVNVNSIENYEYISSQYTELQKIRLSSFAKGDNYPSWTQCLGEIKNKQNTTLVCGFSQHMGILPERDWSNILSEILQIVPSSSVPHGIIFLFYGMKYYLEQMVRNDIRLKEKIFFLNNEQEDHPPSTIFIPVTLRLGSSESVIEGYANYLFEAEENPATPKIIQTGFVSPTYPSLPYQIKCLSSAYAYLIERKELKNIPESSGEKTDWEKLLRNCDNKTVPDYLSKISAGKSINDLFSLFGNESDKHKKWHLWLEMKHCVSSSSLSQKSEKDYLTHVLSKSNSPEDFIKSYFDEIMTILHDDSIYKPWYSERKIGLAKTLSNEKSIFSEFIVKVSLIEDMIYYLTDIEVKEKELLIKYLSKVDDIDFKILSILELVYPDLASYLKNYTFDSTVANAELFTKYFQEYKIQKVTNTLRPDFLTWVDNLAEVNSRPYYRLPTRSAILDTLDLKESCVYVFIDCLGAEFLRFIQDYFEKAELSCYIYPAVANVPTKTEFNTEFKGEYAPLHEKHEIDKIIHDGIETSSLDKEKLPYYIIEELEQLKKYLEDILYLAAEYQKVIVLSDHGSSRLCVLNYINRYNETIKVKAKSVKTRYCLSPEEKLSDPHLFVQSDHYAWANYNRFSISGGPLWEIHGGATIEEIVIPIIEISRHKGNYTVNCQTPLVKPKPLQPPTIIFYLTPNARGIKLEIEGTMYECESQNDTDWLCNLHEDFKAGTYSANVKLLGNKIGSFEFTVERGMKKTNLLKR